MGVRPSVSEPGTGTEYDFPGEGGARISLTLSTDADCSRTILVECNDGCDGMVVKK